MVVEVDNEVVETTALLLDREVEDDKVVALALVVEVEDMTVEVAETLLDWTTEDDEYEDETLALDVLED